MHVVANILENRDLDGLWTAARFMTFAYLPSSMCSRSRRSVAIHSIATLGCSSS